MCVDHTAQGDVGHLLAAVRTFLRQVGDERALPFQALLEESMRGRGLAGASLPVVRHLHLAVSDAPGHCGVLARALERAAPLLRWGQTYSMEDFGADFLDNYGWSEIVGLRGHFENRHVACGFLMLGPGLAYPDHRHDAEEIYVPLTSGTSWSRDGGAFTARAAGELVHHPSRMAHAMKTGSRPLLALYIWRGGALDQRSIIG